MNKTQKMYLITLDKEFLNFLYDLTNSVSDIDLEYSDSKFTHKFNLFSDLVMEECIRQKKKFKNCNNCDEENGLVLVTAYFFRLKNKIFELRECSGQGIVYSIRPVYNLHKNNISKREIIDFSFLDF